MTLVITVTLLMTFTEKAGFIDLLFEVTSAFGTVGLSTGITPNLTDMGRILIILTMFVGRLGPLTIALALNNRASKRNVEYITDHVMIG